MLPPFSRYNRLNSANMDTEPLGYFSKTLVFFKSQFKNFWYVFFGQFCVSVFRTTPNHFSSLGNHVAHVVQVRSKKKVSGVYAGGIVTAMKHLHSFRYFTVCHFPRYAMTHGVYPISSTPPIPPRINPALPKPAFIWFSHRNPVPKTLGKCGLHFLDLLGRGIFKKCTASLFYHTLNLFPNRTVCQSRCI